MAVGPSEGKTKGVWETIATPARIAIVTKPLTNMNSAQIDRPGKRCCKRLKRRRDTRPCARGGSNTANGRRCSDLLLGMVFTVTARFKIKRNGASRCRILFETRNFSGCFYHRRSVTAGFFAPGELESVWSTAVISLDSLTGSATRTAFSTARRSITS